MLDKNIPYIGVLMEKRDAVCFPRYQLPQGYCLSRYREGLDLAWAALQFSLQQTDSLEEANEIFRVEFLSRPEELAERCLFVLDSAGQLVATASIWSGRHFGRELPRIHWVAVAEECQGKGIAKALLTEVLTIGQQLGLGNYVYLTSQTWSYKALNLYRLFGFQPYLGPQPTNWRSDSGDFSNEAKRAWLLIEEKIGTRRLCDS